MDKAVELCDLPVDEWLKLVNILEINESWRQLTVPIPQTLTRDQYEANITFNNPCKYSWMDISEIEKKAKRLKASSAALFLDEWSTFGTVRPTLGHLLHLLVKAKLSKAANYVTVNLLRNESPIKIFAEASDELNSPRRKRQNQEELPVHDIDPSTVNFNIYSKPDLVPKSIPYDDIARLNSSDESLENVNVLEHSSPLKDTPSSSLNENSLIPNLSMLLLNDSSAEIQLDNSNSNMNASPMIPNLSVFNSNDDNTGCDVEENPVIPNLSLLAQSETNEAASIPKLTLDTSLPHYPYSLLQSATNNFDETPLSDKGLFLGEGGCGKVYLARGLMKKPVAVKKINLDSRIFSSEDNPVIRRFRNEVEIVSKYKHENLLALLGYSCDNFKYCLVYDYIPGGALSDRLQNKDNRLMWTERLKVALGVANGVSYLHTAFSRPLIHGDIKSVNILLDLSNKPKLGDFGDVKLLADHTTHRISPVFGTALYFPPEAFDGYISVKTDTFSFGVVLIELLTSLPKWAMDDTGETINLVARAQGAYSTSFKSLLDTSVGSWKANGLNFARKLHRITRQCLDEIDKRPYMQTVGLQLENLAQKSE